MDGTWTIGELAELAAGTLTAGPPHQVSGRVRELPNDRLIRWYVTVGLVDPPLSRTGRIARYGRRHLLQLVAVKRRQAQGRSLAEIQAELLGAPDAYLESVAEIPLTGSAAADQQTADRPDAGDRFWRRVPEQESAKRPVQEQAELIRGVRLAHGVLLLLDSDGAGAGWSPADAAELRSAAGPLLAALARQGHCPETDDQERN